MSTETLLPPDYYLDHFTQVIDGVRARYGFLLSEQERGHLARLEGLGKPARMLYARLVNRRGPCFRIERLDYPEIGPLGLAIAELMAAGLLEPCDEHLPPGLRARLYACFTHAELKAGLRDHSSPRLSGKDGLLAWLDEWDGCAAWLAGFLDEHPVIRLREGDPWPFLRFLFFGRLQDNLSDFVTRALGHVVTESVGEGKLQPLFPDRKAAADAYRMARLYAEFRRVRDRQPATLTLHWWQAQKIERAELSAGDEIAERLIDRLGRRLEREDHIEEALALYATGKAAPARERRARLLIKRGETQAALALLAEIKAHPCHAEEAYAADQLLARLTKTSRRSEALRYQQAGRRIVLDYPSGGVEAAVLAHYGAEGWQGAHAENWLWNAVFGLLLWDIIYDPSHGTFHSPLQFAPSDLHEREFYARRGDAIEDRLSLLHDPVAALALMDRHFDAKQGLANPFISWHADLPGLAGILIERLPPQGLIEVFRHLAQDIERRRRGFPDLFLWREGDYRFVEIKSENDRLAAHQYHWLKFLEGAGIAVSLERIERPIIIDS